MWQKADPHCLFKPAQYGYRFPVVACAVSEYDGSLHVSIGARPVHARLVELPLGSGEPDGFGKQLPEGFEKDEALVRNLQPGAQISLLMAATAEPELITENMLLAC